MTLRAPDYERDMNIMQDRQKEPKPEGVLTVYGLYDDSWKGLIVDDAFC